MISFLLLAVPETVQQKLVHSCRDQLTWGTTYDPAYVRLKYPGGDVEKTKGVCSDVVIRAYRSVGIDLQKEIAEHKKTKPNLYPESKIDTNIDHRRVRNLAIYFKAKKADLPLDTDWKPGDIVYWKLPGGKDHIGILSDQKGSKSDWKVFHNISVPTEEDCFSRWKVVGHYRFGRYK